jgi:hypothetical protein
VLGIGAFASTATVEKWLPMAVRNPYIILSFAIIASTWLDMNEGYSGDSRRTCMVKSEVFSMIDKQLRYPESHADNATLAILAHLLKWRSLEM